MSVRIDDIDQQILDLLVADGRRTVRDIAARVGLTVGPIKRRIDHLEKIGVIEGYTIKVNQQRIGTGLQAVVELSVVGDMDLETIMSFSSGIPEVQEVMTIAGDPDALVRVHAQNMHDLQRVVNLLRTGGSVTRTKTLVILGTWARST